MNSGAQGPTEPVDHPTGLNRRRFLAVGATATVGLAAAACSGGGEGDDEAVAETPPEELNRVSEEIISPGASGSLSVAVASRTDGGATAMTAALAAFPNDGVEISESTLASALLTAADPAPLASGPADIMASIDNPALLAELVDNEVIDGRDGSPLIPFSRHSWGVFYRPTVFDSERFEVPAGLSDLFSLAERMDADGIIPFATANAQGWEALGWFDTLGLRLNGSAFHQAMLSGDVAFNDDRIAQIFVLWQQLALSLIHI